LLWSRRCVKRATRQNGHNCHFPIGAARSALHRLYAYSRSPSRCVLPSAADPLHCSSSRRASIAAPGGDPSPADGRVCPGNLPSRPSALRGVLREAGRFGQLPREGFERAIDLPAVRGIRLRPRLDPHRIRQLFSQPTLDSSLASRSASRYPGHPVWHWSATRRIACTDRR
jgi:hypothetical protein